MIGYLSHMSLEEKIGQMICAPEIVPFSQIEDLVKKGQIGFWYMDKAIMKNPEYTAGLTNRLQEMSKNPLLFAADFERGIAQQMNRGGTSLPSNMAVGATQSTEFAYLCGKITAQEAKTIGLQLVFAPVMDLNNNPDNPIINTRSYGDLPSLVSRLGVAFIKGCQENGAIATAKHFPGHGNTATDTHLDMPISTLERERLENVELLPFKAAIEAGVKTFMTTHIQFPALGTPPGIPATLSKEINTNLLKEKMEFKGVIFTDYMGMRAIANNFTVEESSVRAIQAGVDVILSEEPQITFGVILKEVQKGRITEKRIDESAAKIIELKTSLGLYENRFVEIDKIAEVVGNEINIKTAKEIAQNAVTLVKNGKNLVPIRKNSYKKLLVISTRGSEMPEIKPNEIFNEQVRKKYATATCIIIDENPEKAGEVKKLAEEADLVIWGSITCVKSYKQNSSKISPAQIDLIKSIISLQKRFVLISFGSPYIIRNFPDIETYICSYDLSIPMIEATVELISGEIEAKGTLPVSIPIEKGKYI